MTSSDDGTRYCYGSHRSPAFFVYGRRTSCYLVVKAMARKSPDISLRRNGNKKKKKKINKGLPSISILRPPAWRPAYIAFVRRETRVYTRRGHIDTPYPWRLSNYRCDVCLGRGREVNWIRNNVSLPFLDLIFDSLSAIERSKQINTSDVRPKKSKLPPAPPTKNLVWLWLYSTTQRIILSQTYDFMLWNHVLARKRVVCVI